MNSFPVPIVKAAMKLRVALDFAKRKTFPAPVTLLEIVTSHWLSQAVIVAAELDLAGYLEEAPRSIADLAASTSTHEESLYRLMRTLAASGVFTENAPREFALNDLSRPLLKHSPDSVHGMCMMNGRTFHWNAWGALRHSVRTGESAVEHQNKVNLFEYLSAHPDDSEVFDSAMKGWASQSAQAVTNAVDFSRFGVIADIGGGTGNFLGLLLRKFVNTQGLLFDQEHVVQRAPEILKKHGVWNRCRIEKGSFFETMPAGADAYILKNILHDWTDSQSIQILTSVRQVMKPHGRLFIVESVIPEGNGFHPGKLIDLEMLVCTPGGKERTRFQFEGLFVKSGLKLVRIHATAAIESVVEVAISG